MTAVAPAISLTPYRARVADRGSADGSPAGSELDEEAFLLLYLLMEGRTDDIVSHPEVRRLYLGEEFRL